MDFLKRYPIPIAGLILGLFALGNLVQSYSIEARLALGIIAFILYIPFLLKVLILNVKLSEPLSNPVAASVFPTFTMATMLLAGYVKPYCTECASIIWYIGVIGHALLIVWFTLNFVVKGFAVKKVFPSWFIVYVGIAVASVSAPVTGRLDIGRYAFWFGLVTYICLLIVVCYRVWLVGEIPAPAMPTTVIFAAPRHYCLRVTWSHSRKKIRRWLWHCLLRRYCSGLSGLCISFARSEGHSFRVIRRSHSRW